MVKYRPCDKSRKKSDEKIVARSERVAQQGGDWAGFLSDEDRAERPEATAGVSGRRGRDISAGERRGAARAGFAPARAPDRVLLRGPQPVQSTPGSWPRPLRWFSPSR